MGRDLTQELRDQIHIAHGVSKNFGEFLNVQVHIVMWHRLSEAREPTIDDDPGHFCGKIQTGHPCRVSRNRASGLPRPVDDVTEIARV